MGKFRGLDKDEGWIKRRFLKIEKQMREDRAAKRLQAATIGRGGVTIRDGGFLLTKYAAGTNAAYIGPINPNSPADGSNIAMLDEDGFVIFLASRALAPTPSSTVYLSADSINLVSKAFLSQVYLDDTTVHVVSGGDVQIAGSSGVKIGHTTTGSAANAVLDPVTSLLSRSTSSLRYKQDVEDAQVDAAAVLDMQPRTWRDKAEVEKDPDTETRYVGFIAEELHDLGLGQFVVYDAGGDPEAISYDRLSVALLAVVKDQQATLDGVLERLTALEADDT